MYNLQQNAEDREREVCHSKLTWATRDEALAAGAYARWQYGDDGSWPRPYRCKVCDKWHLARHTDDAA
jgi:hypothetical protein